MDRECKVCHVVKPLEDFYVYWSKPSKKTPEPKAYHKHTCKSCYLAYDTDYRQKHAERLKTKRKARWRASHPLPPFTDDDILTKICSHCGQEKPLRSFSGGSKKNRSGYRAPRCLSCVAQGPPPPKPPKTTKRCTRCKETKPLGAFVLAPHRNGRLYPMSRCYACLLLLNKATLLHLKATNPAGYEAFREQRNAESRAYYAQRVAADPTYRYTKADSTARRRDTRRGYKHLSRVERAAIIARDRSICGICGKPVALQEMSIDHIIPVISGGTYEAKNLQVAHRRCNSRRGAGRLPAQLRLF